MSISAVCECNAEIEAPNDLAGQSVKCPQCAAPVAIPAVLDNAECDLADENFPAELKKKAVAALGTNERLVWLGQPAPTLAFRRSLGWIAGGAVIALITLWSFFGGFGAGAAHNAAKGGGKAAAKPPASSQGYVIGGIFLLGSIGAMVVPWWRRRAAQNTCYALTNRRALVFKPGLFGESNESYTPLEVASLRRSDSWIFAGGGDVIFRTVTVISHSRSSRGVSSSSVRRIHYGFLAVPNVKEVEKRVRETLVDPFVDKLAAANAL
jgi:hypothetical protein